MGKLKHTTSPGGSTTPVHTTTPNNEGIQPSDNPQPDTTSYRVDYRYRNIRGAVVDEDGIYDLTGKWRKSHVVIETLSVLSAWNKAETAIRSKHPSCEFAIIKVIRLDAQRGESEAR